MLGKIEKSPLIHAVGLQKDKESIMQWKGGRTLAQHAVMYILKGKGTFEDEKTSREEVKPGSYFYLFPERWHNFDPYPGTKWTEYWVLYDGTQAVQRFGSILSPPSALFHTHLDNYLIEAFETLHDLWFFRREEYKEYAAFQLHKLLIQFHLRAHHLLPSQSDDIVSRARHWMGRHLNAATLDARALAKDEHISYETFRKQFKVETGMAPNQYYLMLKINRAKELLMRDNRPIKDIARRLGFTDPYYFSRLFKQKAGHSPAAFRKQ